MASTFFQHQENARRRTALLVVLLLIAVALIVLAINAVAYLAFVLGSDTTVAMTPTQWLTTQASQLVTVGTLLVIGLGMVRTLFRLRGGGRALAHYVGASLVDRESTEPQIRKLINVVDEMAIASGTPAPELYVLDDEYGINAFVAGLRPTEAVLVVTRGSLDHLDRDELQGVVAHEYSHIFNGDMRLNLRLMGVLAGILMIGQLGGQLLHSGRRRGSSRDSNGQVVMVGLALFILGYVGVFFASLIKAAVSRQREFLADASAVQFTRNPDGIAGALWKIHRHATGSLLDNAHSSDLSHLCIGEPVRQHFGSLLATHPPLLERIQAINPRFEPRNEGPLAGPTPAPSVSGLPPQAAGFAAPSATPVVSTAASAAIDPHTVVDEVGSMSADSLAFGRRLLAALPTSLLDAVHSRAGARQAIYALLLSGTAAAQRDAALDLIRAGEGGAAAERIAGLAASMGQLGAACRLPLLNLALPALKRQHPRDREQLLALCRTLITLDQVVSLFEFCALTILIEHLGEAAGRKPPVRFRRFEQVREPISLLVGIIAHAGNADEQQAQESFQAALKPLLAGAEPLIDRGKIRLESFRLALGAINQLSVARKAAVLEACAQCVIHDQQILPAEAELLQTIALCLDCPLPPLLT